MRARLRQMNSKRSSTPFRKDDGEALPGSPPPAIRAECWDRADFPHRDGCKSPVVPTESVLLRGAVLIEGQVVGPVPR
jgi:hypothetical protein